MILAVVIGEALLLAAGFAVEQPFLGAIAAGAVGYLVLAYRRPKVAWMLAMLAAPLSVETLIPGGNAIYLPLEPMIGLCLLGWALRLRVRGVIQVPGSGLHGPLALLAGLTLFSIFINPYWMLGLKGFVAAAGYVAFGYLFCCVHLEDPSRGRWIPWVVGWAALWGLIATARVVGNGVSLASANAALRPFFTEHGGYAAYLAMFLPLALLVTMSRRGTAKTLYAAATLSIAMGVAFSLTRAAWVSLGIVIPACVGLWAWRQRRFRPLAWLAGLGTTAVLVFIGVGSGSMMARHAETIAETGDVSNVERFNRWMAAVEMVKDRPLTGVGMLAYPFEYHNYRRKVLFTYLVYEQTGAHSEPMRLLAESGVPGFAAACLFLGTAFVLGFRVFNRASDPNASLLALALLAGLGTYVIHALFRTYFDLEKLNVAFWASLGVLAALARRHSTDTPPRITA